jgi:hypothetical protein
MDDTGPLVKWIEAIATLVMLGLACWQIRVRLARRAKEQDEQPAD